MITPANILQEIEQQFVTKDDIVALKADLGELRHVCYTVGEEEDAQLRDIVKTRYRLFQSLKMPSIDLDNLTKIRETLSANFSIIDAIEEALKSIQYMHFKLAFPPTYEYLVTVKQRMSEIVGKPVLLSVEVEPSILGGIVIEYQGKHLDFTLNTILDSYFSSRKHEILSAL
jgi:hypothetical protein